MEQADSRREQEGEDVVMSSTATTEIKITNKRPLKKPQRPRGIVEEKEFNLLTDLILPTVFTVMVLIVSFQLAVNWLKLDLLSPDGKDYHIERKQWVTVSAFTS